MKIKSSLYIKYIVVALFIMLISSIIGFLATNMYYHRIVKEQNDLKNVSIVSEMADYITNHSELNLQEHLTMLGDMGYQIYIVSENGDSSFYGGDFRLKELDNQIIEGVLAGEIFHGMRDYPRQLFITGFFANDLQNTAGVSFSFKGVQYAMFIRPNISFLFSEAHILLGGVTVLVAIISLLAILVSAWYLVRPIKALIVGTTRIAAEDYDISIQVNRSDELGALAHSFNKMAKQLQVNEEIRKTFIRNVSHDFQSPLQNISGYASLLKNEKLDIASREHYASIIEIETLRLSSLTKQLLLLTSLDQSATHVKKQPVVLNEQIENAVMKYQWLLEKEEISIWLDLDDISVMGDETLLENVWENLLTNAVKYNKTGGEIRLSIKTKQDYVEIVFEDTGIGIAEEDLLHVFERFYRVDASRATKGTGLGLSIVKEIVTLHHGDVQITSRLGQGTKVMVMLPNSPPVV
ncbi:sensor histidine kinase [Solibacillus sp. FSL H8-0538]|uniref:sensor histidine kinase n=1 Tax=Solibacillus sp. FSL H8-0538 TaxID=2921400 RepID=UPI0030F9E951